MENWKRSGWGKNRYKNSEAIHFNGSYHFMDIGILCLALDIFLAWLFQSFLSVGLDNINSEKYGFSFLFLFYEPWNYIS
jgi:hypothetical protein